MDIKRRCLDTYALVEISEGNPDFVAYLSEDITITELILAEFYALMLRRFGEKTALYWLRKLQPYAVKVEFDPLIDAMSFREKNKQKNLSFFDEVGYIFAVRNNFVFVTGDKEFEHLKQVEFRK